MPSLVRPVTGGRREPRSRHQGANHQDYVMPVHQPGSEAANGLIETIGNELGATVPT